MILSSLRTEASANLADLGLIKNVACGSSLRSRTIPELFHLFQCTNCSLLIKAESQQVVCICPCMLAGPLPRLTNIGPVHEQ